MILHTLVAYYSRISKENDSGVAREGFQKKDIPYVIVLDKHGNFKGLHDTRDGEGKQKRARSFTVPHEVKRSGKNAWMTANLLWDSEGYVLAFSSKDPDKARKQHESFKKLIKQRFPDPSLDEGIEAIWRFLDKGDFAPIFNHQTWDEVVKKRGNISFQLEGDNNLICERDAVVNAIKAYGHHEDSISSQCLITGKLDTPARLHTAIKGVWGAQSSGANIVSFNLDAFNSYAKGQGYNAPVGKTAEFAYTTALNTLLSKDSRQRIQVGDSSTVFWAEKESKMEGWFADFFGEPPKGQSDQDNEAIKALFSSPGTGAPPLHDDLTKFYALGLSPNASRIAIRFWYAGTVGEVATNIRQHFNDCSIVHGPKEPGHLSLFRLLVSTAMEGKADNIQPNLSGDVMKSILAGTPYPMTILSSVIRRIRAEREINYPRASLIKAVLVRESRYYQRIEKEVEMSLDPENNNTGYLLGRLFAVLERAQESANPGINATIRDRFYGAASGAPVTAFPQLMKLKNHHIAKLENRGMAVNLEKQIGQTMDGISDFPKHLSLQDQGRFALGYYHQRQSFFTKKEKE